MIIVNTYFFMIEESLEFVCLEIYNMIIVNTYFFMIEESLEFVCLEILFGQFSSQYLKGMFNEYSYKNIHQHVRLYLVY